ncbi:hypothetical protein H1R20_g5105, partial [Candolleomyces eurysporus]
MVFGLFSQNWNPDGKAEAKGLDWHLPKILVTKGAHVSIVARNQQKLDEALAELEAARIAPSQILQAHSASLVSASESTAALEAVCKAHNGQAPDAVITCAGSAKPGFFIEATEQDLLDGMQNGYWIQAWTAWAALKMMVKQKKTGGKICLVSSMLGYMSIIGWSPYAPPKTALRALADTLQSETMLYGIDTQVYFPPTMFSPGLENENKTKPDIVKKIDESDEGQTPEQAAQQFYKEDAASDEEELPEAYWDDDDLIYRCAECNGEVVESVCAFCRKRNYVSGPEDSHPAHSQALSDDRQMAPRGTTPLLDIDLSGLIPPPSYGDSRTMEYYQLLRRGATEYMCEIFGLGFTEDEGIFAWANDFLFNEFSSDVMEEGDKWKIYLGRRIELDEDDDQGASFIEELLDDGVLFAPEGCRWATVKEGPNLWVTRPNSKLPAYEADSDDEEENIIHEDQECDEEDGDSAEAEPWPVVNVYDSPSDETESEPGSVLSVSTAEETDNEGASDYSLHDVGISIDDQDEDTEWEDDEWSEESDAGASNE